MSPPPDDPARWTLDRTQGVAINDPLVEAIEAVDCGEALVDLRGPGMEVRIGPAHLDEEGLAALTRTGVAERLLAARAALPAGVDLLLVEAYRPPALQARYFEQHLAEVTAAHPGWPLRRRQSLAAHHVAPTHVAPHCAGGAVDVTLCTDDGVELDMGTPVNATPAASGNRCFTAHPGVVGEPRRNRDVLSAAMAEAGLVNFGPEWWHWSYGDRYWALRTGAPRAIYDEVPTSVALAVLRRRRP